MNEIIFSSKFGSVHSYTGSVVYTGSVYDVE